jgi:hypothetical protein
LGTRYNETIDLTGASALAPLEDRTIPNPILRKPDLIIADFVSGDERLNIPEVDATAASIRVINPGAVANESILIVEYRHSVPR